MKSTEQKVLKFIDDNELIEKNDKIVVAFSGGPDSVYLLNFLHKFKKKLKIDLAALHVNHKLRGKDSDKDELFCKNFCRKKRIPISIVKKNVTIFASQKKVSVEEAGRILRYHALSHYIKKNNYTKIATAHIAGDNSETILLNMIKGTGLKGAGGIPVKRDNIIRPILCICKDEVIASLYQNHIPYCVDTTNFSNDYERNFIRNEIIPLLKDKLNPNIDNALLRSSLVIKETLQSVEYFLKPVMKEIVTTGKGEASLNLIKIKKYEMHLFGEILKYIFQNIFKKEMTYEDFLSIKKLILKQTGKKLILSDKLTVTKEREKIIIRLEEEMPAPVTLRTEIGKTISTGNGRLSIKLKDKSKLKISKLNFKEHISSDDLDNEFIIRTWQPGDKFYPLGMKQQKKVSDFLTGLKIPSLQKKEKLVLINRNRIVWIIGLRIDNRFKVTPSTEKVCQLWLKKK